MSVIHWYSIQGDWVHNTRAVHVQPICALHSKNAFDFKTLGASSTKLGTPLEFDNAYLVPLESKYHEAWCTCGTCVSCGYSLFQGASDFEMLWASDVKFSHAAATWQTLSCDVRVALLFCIYLAVTGVFSCNTSHWGGGQYITPLPPPPHLRNF